MTSTNHFCGVFPLSVELARIVEETLQPERVRVWLHKR